MCRAGGKAQDAVSSHYMLLLEERGGPRRHCLQSQSMWGPGHGYLVPTWLPKWEERGHQGTTLKKLANLQWKDDGRCRRGKGQYRESVMETRAP